MTITPVVQKSVPLFIEAPGHIEAFNSVELKSQVTGIITGVYYEQGKVVDEGEVLITIDERPFAAKVQESVALVARNQAALKYAEDTTRRNTPLAQEDYISQNSYENLVTNVMIDDAALNESIAKLEIARINLGYCTITAPMVSVAGERLVDSGNLVIEDAGSTLVVLNQIEPIYASFSVSERNFSKIQEKLKNEELETVVSYSNDFKTFSKGKVTFLDNSVDQTTGMIKLKATFDNKDHLLWPGIFVYTRLIMDIDEGALLVPTGAIVNSQKGSYLFVMSEGDTVEQRYVTLGQQENDFIIVKDGVSEGEKVVLEGQLNLTDGKKVSVKQEKKFTDESL